MQGIGNVTTGTGGEDYLDTHINATIRQIDVPEPAWNYSLGCYQVLETVRAQLQVRDSLKLALIRVNRGQ